MDEATTRAQLKDLLETNAPEVGVENELDTVINDHVALIRQKGGGEWDDKIADEYVRELGRTLDSPVPGTLIADDSAGGAM